MSPSPVFPPVAVVTLAVQVLHSIVAAVGTTVQYVVALKRPELAARNTAPLLFLELGPGSGRIDYPMKPADPRLWVPRPELVDRVQIWIYRPKRLERRLHDRASGDSLDFADGFGEVKQNLTLNLGRVDDLGRVLHDLNALE